jgi:hypothetical protein
MTTTVSVDIEGDPFLVDRLDTQLRRELRAFDVKIEPRRSDTTETTDSGKGFDPATVGAIMLAVGSSPVLVSLGRFLREWVRRAPDRKIVVKIPGRGSMEITNADDGDRAAAIDRFFDLMNEPDGDAPAATGD